MSFAEACDLVKALTQDPGTYIFAELAEWEYPYSRNEILLADLWDLLAKVNVVADSDPPTHPRPYNPQSNRANRLGDSSGRTEHEIKAKLRAMSGRSDDH